MPEQAGVAEAGPALRHRIKDLLRTGANVRHRFAAAWLAVRAGPPAIAPGLPTSPRHVVVVRLDDIGDWVMTGPFLRELRAHLPAARITLVCKPGIAALARGSRLVDEVIAYSPPRARVPFDQAVALRTASVFGATLAPRGFDLAILPRRDNDDAGAAMIAYAAGVPVRVGYPTSVTPLRQVKNRGYDRLLTHFVPSGTGRHEVERTLDVVRFLGRDVADDRLEAAIDPVDLATVTALLDDTLPGWRLGSLVAIAPGAALDRRRWPAERFGRLVADVIAGGRHVVVVGGPDDRSLGAAIVAAAGSSHDLVDLTGRCSLPQTTALLSLCDLFVGNDSGPAHLAAAAGPAVVVVSCHPAGGDPDHANAPERFRPWTDTATVVRPRAAGAACRCGCIEPFAHCITTIGVAEVRAAVDRHLPSPPTVVRSGHRA